MFYGIKGKKVKNTEITGNTSRNCGLLNANEIEDCSIANNKITSTREKYKQPFWKNVKNIALIATILTFLIALLTYLGLKPQ